MTTDQMATAVRYRLDLSSTDSAATTQIESALNRAYERLVVKHRLSISQTTVDLVADQNYATLTTGWLAVISARIAADATPLKLVTLERFVELQGQAVDSSTSDTVTHYAPKPPADVFLWPTPASSVTDGLQLTIIPAVTTLTGSGEPTLLRDAYHQILVERAVYEMARAEGMPDEAVQAEANAQILEGEMAGIQHDAHGLQPTGIRRRAYDS